MLHWQRPNTIWLAFQFDGSGRGGTFMTDQATNHAPARDRVAHKNTPAICGIIIGALYVFIDALFFFGIIDFLPNPLSIIGVGGLVGGIGGLVRANKWERRGYESIGRKKAVGAIALSSVGAILHLLLVLFS